MFILQLLRVKCKSNVFILGESLPNNCLNNKKSCMKKTSILFMLSFIFLISNGQTVLTQWYWSVADTATYTQASVGNGTLSFVGNVYGGSAAKWSGGVKTGTYRLSTTNYPTANDSSGATGTVFSTNTSGSYGIGVSYYFKNNSAASRYHRVKYTTDGTTWNTFQLTGSNATIDNVTSGGNFQIDTVNNLLSDSGNSTKTYFGRFSLNFSAITGVDNNPNFKFFITPVFGPGDTAYVPANSAKTYVGGNSSTACLLSYDSVTVSYQSNFPLPVTISNFSALASNNSTKIYWHTANEINIVGYDLQKSTDAVNFKTVNSALAKNSKGGDYAFYDAILTQTTYYRLKINNSDGKTFYSNLISISNKQLDKQLSIYPNPVVGKIINIALSNQSAGIYSLKVISAGGQVLASKQINHLGGNSVNTIDLSTVNAKGLCFVSITSKDVKTTKTVIIK